ncbi:hypothetical protein D910_04144 [Dendroctonus ponderosae]|uniref:DUF4817 domain-containing protein n=1 Tax=Dendroctonus ponderosae TaxID=77166 RepID=U4U320_DENPD|nr:hypothetical protein D910_04144 [Dendroctonus ponderosae]
MKNYPREERIDMIFTLGDCHKNCLLASRVYAQKFPETNHPKPTVFKRLSHQFEETGIIENPNVSRNLIFKSTNISQSSISRIITKHNFYPYKIQLCQELYGNDFENRTVLHNQHVASIVWSSASLSLRSSAIFKCQLSKQLDWQKWVSKLAPQITGLNSTRLLFVGYIKGIVYHTLTTTSHDLKIRIRDAFKTVIPVLAKFLLSNSLSFYKEYLDVDHKIEF